MINKHSEKQYLELETHFFNLFNAVESLLTITEGEDLGTDELKAKHLGALSIRLNEITERFSKIKQGVTDVMFKGNAIHTVPKPPAVSLNENETEKLIERQNEVSDYKNLLSKITLK